MSVTPDRALLLAGGRSLPLARPVIVGVLNLTPDSFSDGRQYLDDAAALHHAQQMASDGAQVIDIGGESTRPGSASVPPDEEWHRVQGVIARLRGFQGLRGAVLSIDTRSAQVAEAALAAGVLMINDISAGSDPRMFDVAAKAKAPIVLMHMRGTPATMQAQPQYEDVVNQVRGFLEDRAQAAMHAGVPKDQIIIDPGIGFGKTTEHNLALLAHLHEFVSLGYPVMLGTSRKRFIAAIGTSSLGAGSVSNRSGGGTPPDDPRTRLGGTCATTALGVAAGVALFRVHDVYANRQAADVAWAIAHNS